MNRTIAQANACNTFSLAPPPFTVKFSQAADLLDGRTCGEGFNMRDLVDDLKVHGEKSQNML